MWSLTCIEAIWFIWCSGSTRAPNELERSHKKEKEFRLGDFFHFLSNGIKFLACFGNCKVEDPHLLKYKGSGSLDDLVEPERKDVRNWLISNEFSVLVAKIFETFGFGAGFEWILSYSKLSVTISNINLLVRNFQLRFRHRIWNYHHFWTYLSNGKPEIWGLWRHCHLIRILRNIILVLVLFWILQLKHIGFDFDFEFVWNKGIGF